MIANGLPNLSRIVFWKKMCFTFKSYFDNKNNCQNVWPTAFATVQIELDHAVDYHNKGSTNFYEHCMLEYYSI